MNTFQKFPSEKDFHLYCSTLNITLKNLNESKPVSSEDKNSKINFEFLKETSIANLKEANDSPIQKDESFENFKIQIHTAPVKENEEEPPKNKFLFLKKLTEIEEESQHPKNEIYSISDQSNKKENNFLQPPNASIGLERKNTLFKDEKLSKYSYGMGAIGLNNLDKSMDKEIMKNYLEVPGRDQNNNRLVRSSNEDEAKKSDSLVRGLTRQRTLMVEGQEKPDPDEHRSPKLMKENSFVQNLGLLSFRRLNISGNYENRSKEPPKVKVFSFPLDKPSLKSRDESVSIDLSPHISEIMSRKSRPYIIKKKSELPTPPRSPRFEVDLHKFLFSEIEKEVVDPSKNDFMIYICCGLLFISEIKDLKLHGKGQLFIQKLLNICEKDEEKGRVPLYEGDFDQNECEGNGAMFFQDEWVFTGCFSQGKANGEGVLENKKEGVKIEGFWKNGELQD